MYHRSTLRAALLISLLVLFINQISTVSAEANVWASRKSGGNISALAIDVDSTPTSTITPTSTVTSTLTTSPTPTITPTHTTSPTSTITPTLTTSRTPTVTPTVTPIAPGAFAKISPTNLAIGITINPTLSWGASSGAVRYEYCYDTINDNACSRSWGWDNAGANTSATLNGLSNNTTYYWQVRAINAGGMTLANGDTWWTFTTQIALPAGFEKYNPVNSSTGIEIQPTLRWGTSIAATSYEYCYDTTNDNACDETWTSTATSTSVTLTGLNTHTTYYWQVRAVNAGGPTYADSGSWSNFTTLLAPPGAFSKISPEYLSSGIAINPTLSWETSSEAIRYEYCLDTTDDNNCDGTWVSTGTDTSSELAGLDHYTVYYWQVRAINNDGITYANNDSWWSFGTIVPPPDAFNKISPGDSASAVAVNSTLSWEVSSGVSGIFYYQYCYDTIDDDNCNDTWVSVDNNSAPVQFGNEMTYYWQVKAVNEGGETYANDGIWWSFTTTVELPDTFSKISPDNSGNGVAINPILNWELTSNFDRYEYCYDTTNDDDCGGTWIDIGMESYLELAELSNNTTYYWQVRAISAGGTTYANDGTWWSFTTVPASTIASINGSVTLQGRPAKPNARWSVPLSVSLTVPGSTQPAYTFTPTTDDSGKFTLTGIVPGTYEVRVKHSHTLQRLKTVTLTDGENVINFGTLLEGDANNDNRINAADFLILAKTYGKCQGSSGYDPRADFNEDTCVTSRDFALLANNY